MPILPCIHGINVMEPCPLCPGSTTRQVESIPKPKPLDGTEPASAMPVRLWIAMKFSYADIVNRGIDDSIDDPTALMMADDFIVNYNASLAKEEQQGGAAVTREHTPSDWRWGFRDGERHGPVEEPVSVEINGTDPRPAYWVRHGCGDGRVLAFDRKVATRVADSVAACASYDDPAEVPTRAAVEEVVAAMQQIMEDAETAHIRESARSALALLEGRDD